MKIIMGVDIGGSTTKIVAFEKERRVLDRLQVRAGDQVTSLYGAIGHMLYRQGLALEQVSAFVLTGVGATMVEGDIYGIPTIRVKEFEAIGHGALELTGLSETLVASVGTGTAFVMASRGECRHVGGSGVGGGTLTGLASRLLNESHIDPIVAMAERGNLRQVDLAIGDISNVAIPSLPAHITAANFGKVESTATKEDLALGLINMLFETVGTLAVFACRGTDIRDVVVTGTVATLPQAKQYLDGVGELYGFRFLIPEMATFATAIGAAALYFHNTETV